MENLLSDSTKWSAKSFNTIAVLFLQVKRARTQSSTGVVACSWPGTCLLDIKSSDWCWSQSCWNTLRETLRNLSTSTYDNPISTHSTAYCLNKLGKWLLLDIAILYWLLSTKLPTDENQQNLKMKIMISLLLSFT